MKEKSNLTAEYVFDFLRTVKTRTISTLIRWGKKHPLLKYPVFVFTVLFIFIYNFFLHLFIQMHMREKLARALALVMSVVLVFTSVNLTALAAAGMGEQTSGTAGSEKVITAFGSLSEDIAEQTVNVGASADEIKFPDTLTVAVSPRKTADSSVSGEMIPTAAVSDSSVSEPAAEPASVSAAEPASVPAVEPAVEPASAPEAEPA